jgi:hypothetical protein
MTDQNLDPVLDLSIATLAQGVPGRRVQAPELRGAR